MSPFKDWFAIGPLGPYVATPNNFWGWVAALGLGLPAMVYALVDGGLGRLLAGGLFAFLFGFSYAIADERRTDAPDERRAEPVADRSDETPLAA